MDKKVNNARILFLVLILVVVSAAGAGFAYTTSRMNTNTKEYVTSENSVFGEETLPGTVNDEASVSEETSESEDSIVKDSIVEDSISEDSISEDPVLVETVTEENSSGSTSSERNGDEKGKPGFLTLTDDDKAHSATGFFADIKKASKGGFLTSYEEESETVSKEDNKPDNSNKNSDATGSENTEAEELEVTQVTAPPVATQPAGDGSFTFLWDVTGVKNQPYLVAVNRAMNTVTVYGLDENGFYTLPVKAFACSVGREGHETVTGRFKTTDKYDWRLMIDDTWARYAIRIYKGIMFHSVGYYQKASDTLEYDEFNKLGEPASLGCIRMKVEDVYWIYQNCPKGFVTVIYDDPTCAGPIGKPETIKIDTTDETKRNWDPTDPDPNSPWNK